MAVEAQSLEGVMKCGGAYCAPKVSGDFVHYITTFSIGRRDSSGPAYLALCQA